MLILISQKEMQNFFSAYFRLLEDFPELNSSLDVVFFCILYVRQDDGMLEGYSQVFLKVMKGGRVNTIILLNLRLVFLFGVRVFLLWFFLDGGSKVRFVFWNHIILFTEELIYVSRGISSF